MLIIAHRGASGEAIENSLSAMALAIAQGADAIELDVQTCDGQLVVFHDATLNQLTNGRGPLSKQTYPALQALMLHPRHGSVLAHQQPQLREPIPTLWQVLQLLAPTQLMLNIELKDEHSHQWLPSLLNQAEQQLGFTRQRCLISAFEHEHLAALQHQAPELRLGALIKRIPAQGAQVASDLGAYALHAHVDHIDANLVQDAQQRGLKIFVYTVNTPTQLQRMHQLQVDGIFTDYPQRSRAILSRYP
ncbi:MAG: glycerophosphodiester phosphodiesterase family protein [Ferrimonas sp.]